MQARAESWAFTCWALFLIGMSDDEEEDLDERTHDGKGSNMVDFSY